MSRSDNVVPAQIQKKWVEQLDSSICRATAAEDASLPNAWSSCIGKLPTATQSKGQKCRIAPQQLLPFLRQSQWMGDGVSVIVRLQMV